MNVGVGLPTTTPGTDGAMVLEWARRADAGPFSSLAVLDRVVYDCLDPFAALAAAAAVTARVRLATMIAIGPLRATALLAKQAASVHALSGRRLTLGPRARGLKPLASRGAPWPVGGRWRSSWRAELEQSRPRRRRALRTGRGSRTPRGRARPGSRRAPHPRDAPTRAPSRRLCPASSWGARRRRSWVRLGPRGERFTLHRGDVSNNLDASRRWVTRTLRLRICSRSRPSTATTGSRS